jgi:hypothetical protein
MPATLRELQIFNTPYNILYVLNFVPKKTARTFHIHLQLASLSTLEVPSVNCRTSADSLRVIFRSNNMYHHFFPLPSQHRLFFNSKG